MNQFKKLVDAASLAIFLVVTLCLGLAAAGWIGVSLFLKDNPHKQAILIAAGIVLLLLAYVLSRWVAKLVLSPLKATWQAVMHVSAAHSDIGAPVIDKLPMGREIVKQLATQIYALASKAPVDAARPTANVNLITTVAKTLPVAILACNAEQKIVFANDAAQKILPETKELLGKNFNDCFNLLFPSTNTLENWLQSVHKTTITATESWDHIRLADERGNAIRQFDITAYYNEGLGDAMAISIILRDRTEQYDSQDEDIGYVALAVHELRTPLTIMRGYIEALEEELGEGLGPELQNFIHRLSASAQQLTSFVSNILNVARVEENQLELHLVEENWPETLRGACKDMELRARVHNKRIAYEIADDIPTVGVDKISIYEVITNLLDNAIKYSQDSKFIHIRSKVTAEGMIETSVQDFGAGIPTSVLPHLFDKFYRGHRNRGQVGGTGLGLYLSKAIVEAHGGQIWAASKEGEGSTFGFTLQPYSKIAENGKNGDNNDELTRSAYGWIKNHSLYRR